MPTSQLATDVEHTFLPDRYRYSDPAWHDEHRCTVHPTILCDGAKHIRSDDTIQAITGRNSPENNPSGGLEGCTLESPMDDFFTTGLDESDSGPELLVDFTMQCSDQQKARADSESTVEQIEENEEPR